MAVDSLQLSSNIGVGDNLAVDTLAGGEQVQFIKLLSAADASETEIHAANGVNGNAIRVTVASDCNWSLQAGTDSIGTVGLDTGTNSVGTVGLNTGTNAIGSVLSAGAVAHDAVGTGIFPELVGAIAYATDGTAPGTAVAEADISRLKSDLDGRLFVNTGHPFAGSVSADYGSAQTNATVKAAPGASLSLYIESISIANGAVAGNVTLLDGSGGTVKFECYPAITSHTTFYPKPAIKLTANTLLAITSTSCTTHAINISGYTAA